MKKQYLAHESTRVQNILYKKVLQQASKDTSNQPIYWIYELSLFNKLISVFGPRLDPNKAEYDLTTIYDIGFHKKTKTLLISNKGATLFSYSPRTQVPHLVRHIGVCLYMPGMGVEMVNVGLVGDVYKGRVVLRSESACTPSFLFESQRCNCAHQWQMVNELAAYFNPVVPPDFPTGLEFELWVQQQFQYKNHKHIPKKSNRGFILLHIDTQNGMGSGFTPGEFVSDLYSRASMRHRGEYTSEQLHHVTMAGGFRAIGINPDPRHEQDNLGYKVIPVVLDYLDVSKKLVLLSNNIYKIKVLEAAGYKLHRLKCFGEINLPGAQEAKERGTEFGHLNINDRPMSFSSEFYRLVADISETK